MTHLDSSFVIDLLRERRKGTLGPAGALLNKLEGEQLALSGFVLCELEAGAARAARPERERQRVYELCTAVTLVLPDERLASVYGETLARILDGGKSIAAMDLLIASTALVDAAPLVTRNRKHFDVVPKLRVISY